MHSIKKIKSLTLSKDQKIFEAIKKINSSKIKILFVVDKKNKLLGSVSSGDIRRSISKKIDLNQNVQYIMFKKPKYLLKKEKIETSKEYLICIPILNKKKKLLTFNIAKLLKKIKKIQFFLWLEVRELDYYL